jgi:hypothetical protein
MAREFEYVATLQDELAIMRDVLQDEDITFYLWDWYPMRKPYSFQRISDQVEMAIRRKNGIVMFYLWGPAYSRQRVVLNPVDKAEGSNEPDVFPIDANVGPLIVWTTSSGTVPLDGVDTVAFGSIYYHPYYYHPDTDTFPKPTQELKDAYKRIVRIAKKHLKKIKHLGEPIYIGYDALARLNAGTLRIRGFGFAE